MKNKTKALALGYKLMQDYSTNLIHLSTDGKSATCNSRFIGFETNDQYADDFACRRCLSRLNKEMLTIAKAESMGFDDDGGIWVAYCNAHDTLINAETKSELTGYATEDFCDCCREQCADRSYICPNCKKGGNN